MNGTAFDRAVRLLTAGTAGGHPRRRLLGGVLAAALVRSGSGVAATCKKVGRRCGKDADCCTKRCRKQRCTPNPGFFACGFGECPIGQACLPLANGGGFCGACPATDAALADLVCGPLCACLRREGPAPGSVCVTSVGATQADCDDDLDCPAGRRCVGFEAFSFCAEPCP